MSNINSELNRIKRTNAIQKTGDNMHPEVFRIALYKLGVSVIEICDFMEMPAETWPDILRDLEDL